MDSTARLIELVREKDILYDPFHPNKKNKLILAATWAEVSSGCGMSVEQAKTRWCSIRTTYGKKKKEAMHRPSGSAAIVKEGWAYFSMCKFLDRYIKHRDTVDNLQESMNDPSSDDQSILLTSVEPLEKDHEEAENVEPCPEIVPAESETMSTMSSASTSPITEAMQQRAQHDTIPGKRKRGTSERQMMNEKMLQFLDQSSEHLTSPKLDKYDHFASFVAMQLRAREDIADISMKRIMDVILPTATLNDNV